MSRISKFRPRHGTIVGYLALFVALGGTSYAVTTGSIDSREIKNGSVRGRDIRNGTVRGRDIRNGGVHSRDVRNHSLLARDFKPGQLPAGPPGPPGSRGLAGEDGASGTGGTGGGGNVTVRSNADGLLATCGYDDMEGSYFCYASDQSLRASCSPGERAVGGGWNGQSYSMKENRPDPVSGTPTGWLVKASAFINGSAQPVPTLPFTVYAVCEAG